MNILAFDTCLGACSVAVGLNAGDALEKVETLYEEMSTGQAERLMPMIDAAMSAAGLTFAQLNRIAVTTGPGTFTGTRIGVAAARALALVTGAGVVGISTLELMANEAEHALGPRRSGALVVTVDAHRGQVYAQAFGQHDPAAHLDARATVPVLLSIAEAADYARSGPVTFVGTGAPAVAALAGELGFEAEVALPRLQPNAAFLLLAAQRAPLQEAPLRPLYLRPADAKPQASKSLARAPT